MRPTPIAVPAVFLCVRLLVERAEVDEEILHFLGVLKVLEYVFQQFFLPGLSQSQSVQGQNFNQALVGKLVSAEGIHGNYTLDPNHIFLFG